METENKCRKKNKNLSSNFYIPPPARKLENAPRLVLQEHRIKERQEHRTKERTLEKLKNENENMKICNNSSLLFKLDEVDPHHVHNSQILVKKKRKRKKNKNLKSDFEKFLDQNSLIQNAVADTEIIEAVKCHPIDEEISVFSDLSIGTNVDMFNSKSYEKNVTNISEVEYNETKPVQINEKLMEPSNNFFGIHSVSSALENSSNYFSCDTLTNELNTSETLEEIIGICEFRSVYCENNKVPEDDFEKAEEMPVSAPFFRETLGITSGEVVTESSQLPCKVEANSELNDDWEKLLNEDDLQNFMAKSEISRNIKIMKKSNNCNEEKESSEEKDVNDCSIIEIYGFPEEFKTQDLYASFSPYVNRGFQLKWVDTTHALGIFPSPLIADEVLSAGLPFVKTRPLSQATLLSKEKAKHLILPSSSRPKTCSALARRLVSGALGVKAVFTPAEIKAEREILKEAREQRRLAAKQRDAAWEGKF